MKQIPYEATWCDYLTPCPYDIDDGTVMVGDYYCTQCPYHKKLIRNQLDMLKCCDYARYTMVAESGVVFCNKDEEI